jgi:hypothetical protein
LSIYRSPEACVVSSIANHTYYLTFLYVETGFGRSVQES